MSENSGNDLHTPTELTEPLSGDSVSETPDTVPDVRLRPSLAASPGHKVLITGPGRSGTTFLVNLLTLLGLDTGFSDRLTDIDPLSFAGLEQGIFVRPHYKSPFTPNYILKIPNVFSSLQAALRREDFVLDHAYIAIRDLESVVRSRARVDSLNPNGWGGFTGEDGEEGERRRSSEGLYHLIALLAKHDLPFTVLSFPRITTDPEYLFEKLEFLVRGIEKHEFLHAFGLCSRPELVHDFSHPE